MKFKKDEQGRALLTQDQAEELYLDYFNNFLTTARFAEHYDLLVDDAINIISRGRMAHEYRVSRKK